MRKINFPLLFAFALLAGCGGGGGGSSAPGGGTANQSPKANINDASLCASRLSVDASASTDSDGSITAYQWDFGDGSIAQGAVVEHSYSQAGDFTVTLTVTDNDAATASISQAISVLSLATSDSVCGVVSVPVNTVVDSDVNDPNANFVSNDSLATAQSLPNPANVGGYLNIAGKGPAGRSFAAGDTSDFYRFQASGGEVIKLVNSNGESSFINGITGNPFADLELRLYNSAGQVIDASLGSGKFRTLSVPAQAGEYAVEVTLIENSSPTNDILQNKSLYGLVIDIADTQSAGVGARGSFNLSSSFMPDDIIVAYRNTAHRSISGSTGPDSTTTVVQTGANGVELHRVNSLAVAAKQTGQQPVYASDLLRRKAQTLRQIINLSRDENVLYAEPNYIRQVAAVPNDPAYNAAGFEQSWYMGAVSLPQAWDITTGSNDVIVAVLDSGGISNHRELDSRAVPGYDFVGLSSQLGEAVAGGSADGDGNDADPTDPGHSVSCSNDPYHGVQVTGIIAAETNNNDLTAAVTWSGRHMPIRVIGDCGGFRVAADVAGGGGATFDIANGILFAAGLANTSGTLPAEAADVINMSFASINGSEFSQTEQNAITAARDQNVVLVAAAGNTSSSTPRYPANYNGVIAVSATNRSGQLSSFSNTGPHIDIAAPGGENTPANTENMITTTAWNPAFLPNNPADAGVASAWGTSMSAPIVSGIIALMKAVNPALTPDEVDNLLSSGQMSDDLGAAGRDDSFGYGLINAQKAVSAAQTLGTPVVTAAPASLAFGTTLTSLTFDVSYGGNEAISVTGSVPAADPAVSVVPPGSTDGLGTYTVNLDRAVVTQPEGSNISGQFSYTFSNGNTIQLEYSYTVAATVPAGLVVFPPAAQSLDFGYGLTQIGLELRNEGTGTFAITSVDSPDGYLSSAYFDSSNGLGLYYIELDRTGLAAGSYTSEMQVTVDNGSILSIPVSFRVLAPDRIQPGNVGVLYAYALSTSGTRIEENLGEAIEGFYAYTLSGFASDSAISVSTDLDNDSNGFVQNGIPTQEAEFLGAFGDDAPRLLSPTGTPLVDRDIPARFIWFD